MIPRGLSCWMATCERPRRWNPACRPRLELKRGRSPARKVRNACAIELVIRARVGCSL